MPRLALRNYAYSLNLAANSDKVVYTATSHTGAFTLVSWFRNSLRDQIGYFFGDTSGTQKIGFNANNILGGRVLNGGTFGNFYAESTSGGTGGWNCFVLIRDSSDIVKTSLNGGAFVTQYSGAAQSGTTSWSRIGNTSSDTQGFRGNISDQKVFDGVAWTEQQAKDFYYAGIFSRTGIVREYLFAEGSGSTANDTSGSGVNGTITGATYSTNSPMKSPRTALTTPRLAVRNYNAALNVASGNYVTVADSDTFEPATFSIAFWFNTRQTGNVVIIEKDTNFGFSVQRDTDNIMKANSNNGTICKGTNAYSDGRWHFCVLHNGSAPKLYIDGVDETTTSTQRTAAYSTGPLYFGSRAGAAPYVGLLQDVQIFNRVLTAQEVKDLYYANVNPASGLIERWILDEGAGSTVTGRILGTSGTITGATFTSNTPMKSRKLVNGNMVPNGEMSYTPPFTAATSTSARFIDGTSGGSTSNSLFTWYFQKSGTATAQFDTSRTVPALKASTTATASYIEIFTPNSTGGGAGYFAKTLIPVRGSTSYTYSFYMETVANSGSASTGARISFIESLGDGTTASHQTNSTARTTTTARQLYTGTFTTVSGARFLQINPVLYGHDGAGTLIMDAFFDSITLTPTTPVTRTAVS